ncbi:MAG: sulfatase [Planctomycetota bacterium]
MKNVILFTIDTLRKDVLGCYGNKEGLTPFLDSIRGKSITFTRHQSAGPYTQASFPGILTSSYFLEYGNPKMLSSERSLVSEVVKKGGFTTAAFHSNPYLCAFFGWNRGWDEFYDSMQDQVTDMVPYIAGDVINKKALDWLGSYTRQPGCKPFFLWVHYMDVHEPYVPEQKYVDKVDASIKLTKDEMFAMFKEVVLPRDASNKEKVELLRKLYCAHVVQVDKYVKEFFGNLKDLGLLEETIVIITTDHGDEFGDHGSLSHDGRMYSELINVPLIIYDSDIQESKVVDTVVSGVDISPTIAHLFGLDVPADYHGQSLLPLDNYESKGAFGEAVGKLAHKVKETDRPAHFYQEDNIRISHRMEDEKWEMYDLSKDPGEQDNIIDSSDRAEKMKNKLRSKINWYDKGGTQVIKVTKF